MSASPPPPPAGSLGGLPRPRFSPLPLPRAPLGGILAAPAAGGPGINGIAAASKSLPGLVGRWLVCWSGLEPEATSVYVRVEPRVWPTWQWENTGSPWASREGAGRVGLRHEAAPRWASGAAVSGRGAAHVRLSTYGRE
jgi:hypothetical protein